MMPQDSVLSRNINIRSFISHLVLSFYFTCRRDLEHAGEEESVLLECDIGGGLALQRQISIPKDNHKVFRIDSSLIARKVGAGSGGFSRSVQILSFLQVLIEKQKMFNSFACSTE